MTRIPACRHTQPKDGTGVKEILGVLGLPLARDRGAPTSFLPPVFVLAGHIDNGEHAPGGLSGLHRRMHRMTVCCHTRIKTGTGLKEVGGLGARRESRCSVHTWAIRGAIRLGAQCTWVMLPTDVEIGCVLDVCAMLRLIFDLEFQGRGRD